LQNDKTGQGPLASYFKGEVLHGRDTDIFTSNMCALNGLVLYGDRTDRREQISLRMYVTIRSRRARAEPLHSEYCALSSSQGLILIGKSPASSFLRFRIEYIALRVLRYVKGAVGETDVPDGLPEFINQRRRWLNGSFFAAAYAIAHIGQMLSSGHSFSRKVALSIQAFYNVINLIASWFAIVSIINERLVGGDADDSNCASTKGNFYLFFVILSSSLESADFHMHSIRYLNSVVQVLLLHQQVLFELIYTHS